MTKRYLCLCFCIHVRPFCDWKVFGFPGRSFVGGDLQPATAPTSACCCLTSGRPTRTQVCLFNLILPQRKDICLQVQNGTNQKCLNPFCRAVPICSVGYNPDFPFTSSTLYSSPLLSASASSFHPTISNSPDFSLWKIQYSA